MSTVYYNEPPNSGKVLIKTTIGDIEVDLWSREAPKACKNFISLCLNKYYEGTIFHRIVKDFIVQGGDPTGIGNGGSSFEGTPFPDEFHQRLKFVRRGLVAMANAGPNDNRSQFFITLAPTPDLNHKHTIFGSVVNNTIYNVLKMEELEIGPDDRPVIPPKILKTVVIDNPFKELHTKNFEQKTEKIHAEAFKHISGVRNKQLLSFEDEDDETEKYFKIKSCHDVLDDPALSKEPVIDAAQLEIEKAKKELDRDLEVHSTTEDSIIPAKVEPEVHETDIDKLKSLQDQLKQKVKSTKRKMKELKEESKKSNKPELVDENELLAGFGALRKDFTANETIGEYILSNSKYSKRKKILPILNKNDQRESLTLNMLKNFESELSKIQQKALLREKDRNEDKEISLETETDWMNHMLAFEKPSTYISRAMDANVESVERYDITDPRNPINLRKGGVKPNKG